MTVLVVSKFGLGLLRYHITEKLWLFFAPTRKFGYEKMCRIPQLAQLPCAKSISKIGSWAELETSINSDI